MGTKKSIYLADNIQRVIGDMPSGELSARIADIVDRYGVLVQMEQPGLEALFNEAELNALCDATWSTVWQPASTLLNGIRADFEDSGPDGLYSKWKVDSKKVIQLLKTLNVGQQIALAELLERMRDRLSRGGMQPKKERKP